LLVDRLIFWTIIVMSQGFSVVCVKEYILGVVQVVLWSSLHRRELRPFDLIEIQRQTWRL
jgi:hypothetical protein